MSIADSSNQCLTTDIAGESLGPGILHDAKIDLQDFAVIASEWLNPSCDPGNQWCNGADLNTDHIVNNTDLLLFANCWMDQDDQPPTPDPVQWALDGEPASLMDFSIYMTAEPVTDNWFSSNVEYYFECTQVIPHEANPNIHSSGWQSDNEYRTASLTGRSEYFFRIFARDPLGNVTQPSVILSAIAGVDTYPPLPSKSAWQVVPTSTGTTANQTLGITMAAVQAVDAEGNPVEYFFKCTSHPSFDSSWRSDPIYNIPDDTPAWNLTEPLIEGQEYTFTVLARDRSENNNECELSDPAIATATIEVVDENPPLPLKTAWETPPEATGTTEDNILGIIMSAQQATDPEASGVEYYFACTSHAGFDSGWTDSRHYNLPDDKPTAPDLIEDETYTFTVLARDKSSEQNECDVSDPADVVADLFYIDNTDPTPDPMTFSLNPSMYPHPGDSTYHHTMTATTAVSDSGLEIEYYFAATGDDDADSSGWISTTVYDYSFGSSSSSALYRVRAREVVLDRKGEVHHYNETGYSGWVTNY